MKVAVAVARIKGLNVYRGQEIALSVVTNVSFQSELPVRKEPVLHRSVSAGSFDWIV
jgi:hypothetical protein